MPGPTPTCPQMALYTVAPFSVVPFLVVPVLAACAVRWGEYSLCCAVLHCDMHLYHDATLMLCSTLHLLFGWCHCYIGAPTLPCRNNGVVMPQGHIVQHGTHCYDSATISGPIMWCPSVGLGFPMALPCVGHPCLPVVLFLGCSPHLLPCLWVSFAASRCPAWCLQPQMAALLPPWQRRPVLSWDQHCCYSHAGHRHLLFCIFFHVILFSDVGIPGCHRI